MSIADPAVGSATAVQPAGSPLVKGARIVVCAATFNRPKGLEILLAGLERLTFREQSPDVRIVIVDNSRDGNAQAQVEKRADGYRWPLRYAHQTERGIAQARNMALEIAMDNGADWVAYVDDDEYPEPEWLDCMMRLAASTGSTAVVGTVLPDFEQEPRNWMAKGGFFSIQRYAEGAELDFGNTSNVLFDRHFVARHNIRFDLAFALTGGEDTLFFEELLANGGSIVFCRSGVVRETIVPHRARLGWLVKRWMRSGNTDGRILLRKRSNLARRVGYVFGGGLMRFGIGGGLAVLTAPAALAGRGHIPAEHLRVASRGWGFMMSAFGSTIEEYKVMKR